MEAAVAQSLASGIDPTAIAALKGHPNDPAVRRAVASQFGAMLMEGLMRNADGSPLAMVDGIGGDTVSTLYTDVMSQVAASNDRLGLADMLLKSIPGGNAASPPTASNATTASSAMTPPAATATTVAATGRGLSLQQYWQGQHITAMPGTPLAISGAPVGARAFTIAPQARTLPGSATGTPAGSGTVAPTSPGSAPASAPSPYDSPIGPSSDLSFPGGAAAPAASRQRFATTLAPLLANAAQHLGVSPNVLLAQAALESGWGRSMPGNNLFGVKAGVDWTGDTVQAYTHEVSAAGQTGQTESFRAYPSLAAAVADYVQLIAHDARYRAALGTGNDPLAYGQALVQGGYATDPDYASKLAAVAASPTIAAALNLATGTVVAQAATGAAGGGA